jgi:hypothetical protein
LERVQLVAENWADAQRELTDTEARMTAVLDELGLTALMPLGALICRRPTDGRLHAGRRLGCSE